MNALMLVGAAQVLRQLASEAIPLVKEAAPWFREADLLGRLAAIRQVAAPAPWLPLVGGIGVGIVGGFAIATLIAPERTKAIRQKVADKLAARREIRERRRAEAAAAAENGSSLAGQG
jgi:hypothetical protein